MQCFTNQDSNCVCDDNFVTQDMHHDDMVCMLWEVLSLMCTSHVAGNTQRLVSMGKIHKFGLWWLSMWLSMQWQECKMMGYHDTKMRLIPK